MSESEGVTDDKSSESTEEDDVIDAGKGKLKIQRLGLGWGWHRESGSWFRDKVKNITSSDQLHRRSYIKAMNSYDDIRKAKNAPMIHDS